VLPRSWSRNQPTPARHSCRPKPAEHPCRHGSSSRRTPFRPWPCNHWPRTHARTHRPKPAAHPYGNHCRLRPARPRPRRSRSWTTCAHSRSARRVGHPCSGCKHSPTRVQHSHSSTPAWRWHVGCSPRWRKPSGRSARGYQRRGRRRSWLPRRRSVGWPTWPSLRQVPESQSLRSQTGRQAKRRASMAAGATRRSAERDGDHSDVLACRSSLSNGSWGALRRLRALG